MKVLINHVIEFTSPDCDDFEERFAIVQCQGEQGLVCISVPDGDKEGVELTFVKAAVKRVFEGETFATTRSDFEYSAASPERLIKFIGHINTFNEVFNIYGDTDKVFDIYTTQEEV